MVVLQAFPVLAVVVAAYNFVVVLGSRAVGDVIREVTLPSGAIWPITVGDVFIVTALVLVLIEFASLGSGRASVVNHALSGIVFMICVAELLFVRGCGTAEFALMTLIVGLDVCGRLLAHCTLGAPQPRAREAKARFCVSLNALATMPRWW
jgi:hypothetical protein